jgi:hypothetical protein
MNLSKYSKESVELINFLQNMNRAGKPYISLAIGRVLAFSLNLPVTGGLTKDEVRDEFRKTHIFVINTVLDNLSYAVPIKSLEIIDIATSIYIYRYSIARGFTDDQPVLRLSFASDLFGVSNFISQKYLEIYKDNVNEVNYVTEKIKVFIKEALAADGV